MKSTAQPSLSMTTIREIWISIPPIPEQQRIVAKVDELFALCDQLKACITHAQEIKNLLASVVVEGAVG